MINIQSGIYASEPAFEGAYQKRMSQKEAKAAADKYASSATESKSIKDYIGDGATITISPESQAFMAGVAERKAAQREEMERLKEQYSANPFAYSGNGLTLYDLESGERVPTEPTQHLVFSKNLYQSGFYDNMSDEEVKQTEDRLKEITSGVESLYGLTDLERYHSKISHEAARQELLSSISALYDFADKYLPENMRESFKNLIKDYEDYNNAACRIYVR